MNPRNVAYGGLAGLSGGLVFGILLWMMGTLPMIGKMVGIPSAAAGFLVHLGISAMIGAAFAVLLARRGRTRLGGLVYGTLYGGIWWILGPLTLMPLFLGMGLGVNWNLETVQKMLPGLWGHLAFGAVLGFAYAWLRQCAEGPCVVVKTDQPAAAHR